MKKIGKLFLVLGLIFCYAGCKITTSSPVELTKIEITSQPDKTEYFAGEELDTTGLKVTALYSDGTKKDVTAEITLNGYDKTKNGEQKIEVSYSKKKITKVVEFNVTVKAVELTKIEITTEPSKKEYFVGATTLDTTEMAVTATYNNGTTADVTKDATVSGFNSSAAVDSQTITVTYGGKTATFTVKINPVLLTGIAITNQPTKKDYHIGDEIDLAGMVVTANYNDGSTKTLASKEYTVTGFDSTDYVKDQVITVTHNDKTDTFKISVVFSWFETPKQLPAGTNGTYGTKGTYVLFGVWPQDVVPVDDEEALALDETAATTIERGYLKYVKGSDGNYYVKCTENAFESGYKYEKDKSDVGGTGSRWFKVMPIKWRVVDPDYKDKSGSSQGKLLVAEIILTANVPYYESTSDRTISDSTLYANNYMHSQIRAYLNGGSYQGQSEEQTKWKDKGFLQTAFTSDAIDSIILTKVDNSEDSTKNYDNQNGTVTKATDYACDPTDDKIFLLSEYEVTKYSKSTEAYNSNVKGNSRIRVTTDFAKANKAEQSKTNGYGGHYWLRSPFHSGSSYASCVSNDGYAGISYNVSSTFFGVVPALAISF